MVGLAKAYPNNNNKAGMVNHATKNETAKNTDIPYKAGTVNHATRLKWQRLLTYFGTWPNTWLWEMISSYSHPQLLSMV